MNIARQAAIVAALWVAGVGSVNAQTSRGIGSGPGFNQISAEEVASMLRGGNAVAGSGVVRIDESAFQAGSGLITFSELPLGSVNPSYAPATYGGGAGDPQVDFAGFFTGQALGDPATCPPGAALSGCVIGDADGPLSLDAASPATTIVGDGANPTSPVLSGSPTFNGPIAILFDSDIAGVGLDGGFFDDVGGTAITAFARDGTVIGSVLNEGTAIEFLGLVTADGSDTIAGLLFSLVGAESAGFAIDNLRFGTGDVVIGPGPVEPPEPVPALGSLAFILMLLGVGVIALVAGRR
jgi:hypothetical protein